MKVLIVLACIGIIAAKPQPSSTNERTWFRNRTGGRIVGGQETTIDQHPYQVAMLRGGAFYCGAAIIGNNWVISAAHCLETETNPSNVQFRAGSTDRAEGGQVVTAASFEIHPDYKTPTVYSHDVSLILTATPFIYNPNVRSVALPAYEWDPVVGSDVTVSGWGRVVS